MKDYIQFLLKSFANDHLLLVIEIDSAQKLKRTFLINVRWRSLTYYLLQHSVAPIVEKFR